MDTGTRTLLFDWSIHNNKNKAVIVILVLVCLALIAIPIVLSPFTSDMIMKIGFGQYCAIWLALILAITIIHEGLHGVFFYYYSKKVRFGVKWKSKFGPTPYASSPDSLFTKKQFQVISLAPQILTVAVMFAGTFFSLPIFAMCVIFGVANLGGGCIDLWTAYELQKLPDDIMVEDTKDGFRVWANIPDQS
jgi:hypothetical protein